MLFRSFLVLSLLLVANLLSASTVANFSQPDFDRWNYPFNASPGVRGAAATFAAFTGPPGGANATFDQRDGQFLLGFDTSTQLPTLPANQQYVVNSVTVTATHFTGSFLYDPTYDSFSTHVFAPDTDAGRPIVLSGAGLRPGYSAFSFASNPPDVVNGGTLTSTPPFYNEDETFGFGDPTTPGIRTAFAADASGVNISNNVADGFDFTPFAVGQTNLNPGDPVVQGVVGTSAGSTFTFDVNLNDADILDYVEEGINSGQLFFAITSLHASVQGGATNPNFYTSDNFDPAAITPTMSIDFSVVSVPEPVSLLAMLGAVAMFVSCRRRFDSSLI